MKLHFLNHHYHINQLADDEEYVLINDCESAICDQNCLKQFRLLENTKLKQRYKLFTDFSEFCYGLNDKHYTDFYFWGCQDALSYRALNILSKNKHVVIDNVDFFLKFYLPKISLLKFLMGLVKSIFLHVAYQYLQGQVVYRLGRMVFKMPRNLNYISDRGFLRRIAVSFDSDQAVFISQPYYLDYNIDETIWTNRVLDLLSELSKNETIFIKYHTRDSSTFRKKIQESGFEETQRLGSINYGLFSTLLFEASMEEKILAISKLNYFEDLLPDEYKSYCNSFFERFELDPSNLNGENLLKIWERNVEKIKI